MNEILPALIGILVVYWVLMDKPEDRKNEEKDVIVYEQGDIEVEI